MNEGEVLFVGRHFTRHLQFVSANRSLLFRKLFSQTFVFLSRLVQTVGYSFQFLTQQGNSVFIFSQSSGEITGFLKLPTKLFVLTVKGGNVLLVGSHSAVDFGFVVGDGAVVLLDLPSQSFIFLGGFVEGYFESFIILGGVVESSFESFILLSELGKFDLTFR